MHTSNQPSEAESSDDSAKIKSLEAELLQRRQNQKTRRIYESFVKRFQKQESLPSRPCGDLRPYRYSPTPNAGLKSIPIATFVQLAKYLTKTEVEELSASSKQLTNVAKFLSREVDFPNHWYTCYANWRSISSLYADEFFLGMSPIQLGFLLLTVVVPEATEAIKAAHNIHEPPNVNEPRSTKRSRLERTETDRLDSASYCLSHNGLASQAWETCLDGVQRPRPTNREVIDASSGDQILRDDSRQSGYLEVFANNTASTATTVRLAMPSPVKYTLAYAYKAGMENCFAPLFIEKLKGTAAWGIDKTTSCIRAHALEDAVEFEIDWGYPTAPPTPDIFQQEAWGEVAIKQVTQLTIRVPFNQGQDVIQRIFYPTATTQ
ncbi:hypothetical protein CLIM01_14162 [Colletotrichum limetticola]|uniref:F-box domain-containing protein n=1 Tax=Colletotrichum limetticola TaxID=1209924 RepID=A0ABQ9P8P9_9PEZI|nr:hypothetical protein CLIM01_14162 [Colletotrichum limetticola]